jgi:transcription elongation GreA/GreB family factor
VDKKTLDKKTLIDQICKKLEKDLAILQVAAMETHSAATSEQAKPENQYDTRAVEASYLAGAQAKRAYELDAAITAYKYLDLKSFAQSDPIAVTALVELNFNKKKLVVFLVPQEGGFTVELDGNKIQVITLASPLGQALLGARTHDIATIDRGDESLEYEVLKVS